MTQQTAGVFHGIWGQPDGLVILVGERGGILRSVDGGHKWRRMHSPSRMDLLAVTGRGSHVLAVGREGTVIRSDNRGVDWWLVRQGGPRLLDVALSTEGAAVTVGRNGRALFSEDGGAGWSSQRFYGQPDLVAVRAGSDGLLHLLAADGLLISGSPASAWQAQRLQAREPRALAVRDDRIVVGDRRGRAYRSEDGGHSWTAHAAGRAGALRALWIAPEGEQVLGAGERGTLVRGEGVWQTAKAPVHATDCLCALWGDGQGSVFALGKRGVALVSRDGGRVYEPLAEVRLREMHTPWVSVRVTGALSGMGSHAGHLFLCGDRGALARTPDAGLNWSTSRIDTECWIHDLIATDKKRLHAVGYQTALRSTDGGVRWTSVYRAPGETLSAVAAAGEGQRLAISARRVHRGIQRAPFWQAGPRPMPGVLHALAISPRTGTALVAGSEGGLARSEDGGRSWVQVHTEHEPVDLHGAAATDSGLFFVVGDRAQLLASADDGRSWRKLDLPVREALMDVAAGDGEVHAVGADGVALWSADGGESFTLDHTGSRARLQRVLVAPRHVWALGRQEGDAVLLRRPRAD